MTPRPKTSWRSWSDIINEPAAAEEAQRIDKELKTLSQQADFPVTFLPLAKVTTPEQAAQVQQGDFDVVLVYTASNYGLFPHCWAKDPRRDTVVFARHESGSAYFGYEYLGVQAGLKAPSPELWRTCSTEDHGGVTLDDVVIDDYDEILWRLRALYGLKNFVGTRILGIVTCAHCTAPRRMDGRRYERVRLMTHYESDFGAAPKVEMPIGQAVCAISPEYAKARWVGIRGTVRKNPCLPICRSQQDVEIHGAWQRLIPEARNSHWMMVYGDYLREVGYAADGGPTES